MRTSTGYDWQGGAGSGGWGGEVRSCTEWSLAQGRGAPTTPSDATSFPSVPQDRGCAQGPPRPHHQTPPAPRTSTLRSFTCCGWASPRSRTAAASRLSTLEKPGASRCAIARPVFTPEEMSPARPLGAWAQAHRPARARWFLCSTGVPPPFSPRPFLCSTLLPCASPSSPRSTPRWRC